MSAIPASARHPVRTYLGAPVSVGLVVRLERLPGEEERERIVTAARAAFGEEGRVDYGPGGFRWSAPRAAVEVVRPEVDPGGPALDPDRPGPLDVELRAGAHLSGGELLPLLGVAVLGLNTAAAVVSALGAGPSPGAMLPVVALNALLGTGLFVAGQLRARRWSRKARKKLDRVAAAAQQAPAGGGRGPGPGGAGG